MSRLAIVDRTRLRVVDLDNNRAVDIGATGDARLANRQPAWSPDGAKVAWSAFDRRQPDSPAALALATPEGTWRVDHPVVFPPFYVTWRPDGAALAWLAEGPLGIELSVTDAKTGATEIISRDAPLWLAWSQHGALAVHSGRGSTQALTVFGDGYDPEGFAQHTYGDFTTPAFLPDGSVVCVVEVNGVGTLATLDRDGKIDKSIAAAEFGSRFCIDPTGTSLAVTTGPHAVGAFVIHDLETATMAFVDERPPAAFSWSPTGKRLLVGRADRPGDHPLIEWCTVEDGVLSPHVTNRATTTFVREVLPFHEQYTRSHSWWSPDGHAFCYSSVDDYNNDAVSIFDLKNGARRVATGSLSVWSPR